MKFIERNKINSQETFLFNKAFKVLLVTIRINLIKKLVVRIFLILILLTTNSYAMNFFDKEGELPTTPISVPINISKKGGKLDLTFEIKKNEKFGHDFNIYFKPKEIERNFLQNVHYKMTVDWFGWLFYITGLGDSSLVANKVPEDVIQDQNRIKKLIGGSVLENGKWVKYAEIPLLVNIKISEIINEEKENLIINKTIEPKSDGGTYSKNIFDIKLKKGIYKVVIENMKNNENLKENNIFFTISENRTVDESRIINY